MYGTNHLLSNLWQWNKSENVFSFRTRIRAIKQRNRWKMIKKINLSKWDQKGEDNERHDALKGSATLNQEEKPCIFLSVWSEKGLVFVNKKLKVHLKEIWQVFCIVMYHMRKLWQLFYEHTALEATFHFRVKKPPWEWLF